MTREQFQRRTRDFALAVIRVVNRLPPAGTSGRIGGQLVNAAGSVAANYRAACRARSRAEFIAKLGIVEEEADEAALWLDLLAESDQTVPRRELLQLVEEASQITAMVVKSIRTARGNQ
jgi:four helix bundle protein